MDPLVVLGSIEIPSPCSADWLTMAGDQRSRFCEGCGKHVHNLSALTVAEVGALVAVSPSKLCVRFERKADGTVRTTDRIPSRVSRWAAGLLVGASALGGAGCGGKGDAMSFPTTTATLNGWVQAVIDWFRPADSTNRVMGDWAPPMPNAPAFGKPIAPSAKTLMGKMQACSVPGEDPPAGSQFLPVEAGF